MEAAGVSTGALPTPASPAEEAVATSAGTEGGALLLLLVLLLLLLLLGVRVTRRDGEGEEEALSFPFPFPFPLALVRRAPFVLDSPLSLDALALALSSRARAARTIVLMAATAPLILRSSRREKGCVDRGHANRPVAIM